MSQPGLSLSLVGRLNADSLPTRCSQGYLLEAERSRDRSTIRGHDQKMCSFSPYVQACLSLAHARNWKTNCVVIFSLGGAIYSSVIALSTPMFDTHREKSFEWQESLSTMRPSLLNGSLQAIQ
jgi:hypothetical protein